MKLHVSESEAKMIIFALENHALTLGSQITNMQDPSNMLPACTRQLEVAQSEYKALANAVRRMACLPDKE